MRGALRGQGPGLRVLVVQSLVEVVDYNYPQFVEDLTWLSVGTFQPRRLFPVETYLPVDGLGVKRTPGEELGHRWWCDEGPPGRDEGKGGQDLTCLEKGTQERT